MRRFALCVPLVLAGSFLLLAGDAFARTREQPVQLAAAPQAEEKKPPDGNESKLSPEQRMARRFPQPIRVGDLVGLPVIDGRDSTIGYVQQVVRTADGKIRLIVPYARRLGWLRAGNDILGRRLVPVPIEAVAALGKQVAALDMSREEFDAAAAWEPSQGQPIPPNEIIRIALTKR